MSPWIIPLCSLFFLLIVFSFRQLSDPDTGFHLNAGRWIANNLEFPSTDFSTYTVPDHPYIDLHWLFQTVIYGIYSMSGYVGLNCFVLLVSAGLFFLFLFRCRRQNISSGLTAPLMLPLIIMLEPRIHLRPELFTWLLMAFMLMILDGYYQNQRNCLFLLPLIMLLWCNSEGLFILGFLLMGGYFISLWIKHRKPDRKFLLWLTISAGICLINPYGMEGLLFPFGLLSRFRGDNIFNQHITEFMSVFELHTFTSDKLIFIPYAAIAVILILATIRKRVFHEVLLAGIFLVLALVAVRNIPLFLIVSLPVVSVSLRDITELFRERLHGKTFSLLRIASLILLTFLPLAMIPRILTDAWYSGNHSCYRTGVGINTLAYPEDAARFLTENNLTGRIINSLGYGGWLSWRLDRPVFIDGRLEVIGEELYSELVRSWKGNLDELLGKYRPDIVIYDYTRYYPWTSQLVANGDWRPVYLDRNTVIFARKGYAPEILRLDGPGFLQSHSLPGIPDGSVKNAILELDGEGSFISWVKGFYRPVAHCPEDLQNMATFFMCLGDQRTAERLFLESLHRSGGDNLCVYRALAGIYLNVGEPGNAKLCLNRVLDADPRNEAARIVLAELDDPDPRRNLFPAGCTPQLEAAIHFNRGNRCYREGKIEAALSEYTSAVRLDPMHARAYNNRGIIEFLELQQYRKSFSDFDSALRIDPAYSDALLGRGTTRLTFNDPEGALRDWLKADSLGNTKAAPLIEKHFGTNHQ